MRHFSFPVALVLFLGLFLTSQIKAQKKAYEVSAIGFYNFENLFDTLDSKDTRDTEFTPKGRNRYNTAIYKEKMTHLAEVVEELATELTPDGLAILGVAEVENRSVLEDFVRQPEIADRNYRIVHYESPDFRGIDVALLYNPKYYAVTSSRAITVPIIKPDGDTSTTRDILHVTGDLGGEKLHVFVNHWPSRSGGEKASRYKRNYAASICRAVIDSILKTDQAAKIIVMGDLNDDPVSPSVKRIMRANGNKDRVSRKDLYNPMEKPFKQGIGTLAWRDTWNLFDQILLSSAFVDESSNGFRFYKSVIYNPTYLLQPSGQFKGYPYRSFAGGQYLGGYSDHFPVFVYLIREIQSGG